MAWAITEEFPQTWGEGLWQWKEKMVAAGGTVTLSSDGVSGGPFNVDQLDPGGPYAGTMDNVDAWVVVQMPSVGGVVRETLFQINNQTVGFVRKWVSADGIGFSGGGTTTRPTAADEQFLIDGSENIFSANIAGFPVQCFYWIGDVAEGYSWALEGRRSDVGSGPNTLMFVDVLLDSNTGDTDPAVYGFHGDIGSSPYVSNSILHNRTNVNNATQGNIVGRDPSGAWVAYPWKTRGITSDRFMNQGRPAQGELGWWIQPIMYTRGDPVGYTPDGGFGTKGRSRIFRQISEGVGSGQMIVDNDGMLRSVEGVLMPWSSTLPKSWV